MKDRIKEIAESYFISVTLINIAIYATGMIFRPEQKFGYEAFLSPLLFGLLTVLPTVIMYSPKELTIRQLLFRKAIQLLLDIVIVIAAIFTGNEISKNTRATSAGLNRLQPNPPKHILAMPIAISAPNITIKGEMLLGRLNAKSTPVRIALPSAMWGCCLSINLVMSHSNSTHEPTDTRVVTNAPIPKE
jgi:hypothetical protein